MFEILTFSWLSPNLPLTFPWPLPDTWPSTNLDYRRFSSKQALRRFLWAAQFNCKLCANSLQSVFALCAISEKIVCKHRHTDKNTSCCTFRVAFIAKTDMPSLVYCASVHKTSLLYRCTKNQFAVQVYENQLHVQVYTKPVYCTSVYKTSLMVNN